jgi:uncharacterized protein (DUF2147 family)
MARFGILIVVIAALFGAAQAGAQGAEPIGIWLTQAGDAGVRVSKCGGGICGVIVWSMAGSSSLRVEGCVGAICGGETWTRAGN